MDTVDDRRWHIFKSMYPPGKPWHVELTRQGIHCPSPNDPAYAVYDDARLFVSNHVTAAARRREQLAARRESRNGE